MDFSRFLADVRSRVDRRLDELLPGEGAAPALLAEPLRDALLSPGKRLRPAVLFAAGRAFGQREDVLVDTACAIEMIHSSSLVFDDLPCMDHATLRRGLPALHVRHGEDLAILAAVELLNRGHAVVVAEGSRRRGHPVAELLELLTRAIGVEGVVAGQAVDLRADATKMDLETLEFIHSHKTGALFIAAAEAGAVLGGARSRDRAAVVSFAKNVGLAFQITDDVLDATGTPESTGKDTGQDAGKVTFVALLGVDGARQLAGELTSFAEGCLEPFGTRAELLVRIARHVRDRA